MEHNTPMTVGKAIERLQQLPKDAKLIVPEWDSDYMGTYYSHVYGFADNGYILKGLCVEDWYEQDGGG